MFSLACCSARFFFARECLKRNSFLIITKLRNDSKVYFSEEVQWPLFSLQSNNMTRNRSAKVVSVSKGRTETPSCC